MSNPLRTPLRLQHARFSYPSPSPGVCSDSQPLSYWCQPTILSSVVPFSSCLQSFRAWDLFQWVRKHLSWIRKLFHTIPGLQSARKMVVVISVPLILLWLMLLLVFLPPSATLVLIIPKILGELESVWSSSISGRPPPCTCDLNLCFRQAFESCILGQRVCLTVGTLCSCPPRIWWHLS